MIFRSWKTAAVVANAEPEQKQKTLKVLWGLQGVGSLQNQAPITSPQSG